jgi:O-antigen/teichoic acid export membrane protein
MNFIKRWSGDGLRGKSVRSSLLTLMDVASQNAVRLGGNLILTRILFPEAFGLMALVQVVMIGLKMFSDIGIRLSIVQNRRGDDPLFLDTAWVLQIGRGLVLWLATWALAAPVAAFYDAPLLAQLLPVAGLVALFQGLASTKLATANRNLALGRVTAINICGSVLGLIVLVILALWLETVWALVIGGLVAPFTMMVASHLVLPGFRNRFRFDPAAARDLIGFGRYIFLSTLAGFLVMQADRALLGKFIPLSDLALYNIAIMLATLPRTIQTQLFDKVLYPLYSKRPPSDSVENYNNIARARMIILCGTCVGMALLAVFGHWLVVILYDPRYEAAGALLVLMAIAALPGLIGAGYPIMVLSHGHSGRFAGLVTSVAAIHTAMLLPGVWFYGAIGAALAPFFASILCYPVLMWFIAPYKGWVPRQDLAFALAGLAIAAVAIWFNGPVLQEAFTTFALH